MRLLVVVGPTASGKTALAVRVAERVGGEIISADSVQVYRGFDIGSGKPTADELARAPHHLLDCVDPSEPMDAARWAELADAAIAQICQRCRVPIVCGGTFLYVKALLYGLAPAPPADSTVRERHRALAETEGRAALHEKLREVDPACAARLAPNDLVRVSRALEVYELSGTTMTEWQGRHGFREPRFDARLVGVATTREALDSRIKARVAHMMAAGWMDEVRALVASGHRHARAMSAVGYKQVLEAIDSGNDSDQDAVSAAVVRATRIFARRQRTWLRDQPVEWIEPTAGLEAVLDWLASSTPPKPG